MSGSHRHRVHEQRGVKGQSRDSCSGDAASKSTNIKRPSGSGGSCKRRRRISWGDFASGKVAKSGSSGFGKVMQINLSKTELIASVVRTKIELPKR
jgi:hypothetical protein